MNKVKPANCINKEEIEDELADIVDWNPVLSGGAGNFDSHVFVVKNNRILRFYPTITMLLFTFIPICLGALALVNYNTWPTTGVLVYLLPILAPSLFIGGIYWLMSVIMSYQFDCNKRTCTKIKITLSGAKRIEYDFSFIKAIQILRIKHDTGGYSNYQMNLLFNNGLGSHVVTFYSRKKLRDAAILISQYSGIPVWQGDW
jgi:hypothetical protein